MPSCQRICMPFLVTSVLSLFFLHANTSTKLYDLPQAMIRYTISGGGALSPDTNLTIKGRALLHFSKWGETRLIQRHIWEESRGSLYYSRKQQICSKYRQKEVQEVDYLNKKILQRPLPQGIRREDLTVGLHRSGQQMVADVVCDMWEGNGVRRCIYKGIPLFNEYRVADLFYREEATQVILDINSSYPTVCTLPSYPVEKFSLYKSHFKTKSKRLPESMVGRFKKVVALMEAKGYDTDALPDHAKKEMLNIIAAPIFDQQKIRLPELLLTLKRTRACLMQVETTLQANRCMEALVMIKSYFTDNMHNRIDVWEEEKEKLLDDLERYIAYLEVRMKCIRSAKHFVDLSGCMHAE